MRLKELLMTVSQISLTDIIHSEEKDLLHTKKHEKRQLREEL